jgi:hypothetical protein
MLPPRAPVRNLVVFTAVVLASGWLGHGLDLAMGAQAGETLGMLLWLVAPALTALLLRALAGDGWQDAGFRLNLTGHLRLYAAALVIFPAVAVLTIFIGTAMGLTSAPGLSATSTGTILQTTAAGALPQFLKNIFEESAWRGYLAPNVYQTLGLSGYRGHLLVGLIWGAWHIPYYLFFLDRSTLDQFTTMPLAIWIPWSIGVMVVWAIVYGELYLLTRSIRPAVIMHMSEDAFLNPLLLERHVIVERGADWLVSPVNGLVSVALFAAVGWVLRRQGLSRRPHA